ncbi:MAG: glycosyltransferase family 2 protein [Solirubrobacteraceae bacterium]
MSDAIAVVVVTHNSAAVLEPLVRSLQAQLRAHDELVIVDNASTDDTLAQARRLGERARVIEAGANDGFAAGCRLGAQASASPLIFLLNPDTVLADGALERLAAVGASHPGWAAWQPAVMLSDGRINSAGGVVHYLGIGWAGRCGAQAGTLAALPYETAFPSGAALVVRREDWLALDGLRDDYFLYGEDLDLGLRLWLSGRGVGVEPRARVIHDYVFEKGPQKWYLLERNRWRTLLATYPLALLAALAPALAAGELGILLIAARDGWLSEKLRAQLATVAGLPRTLERRRAVSLTRRIGSAAFAAQLTGELDNPNLALPRAVAIVSRLYWRIARRLLH